MTNFIVKASQAVAKHTSASTYKNVSKMGSRRLAYHPGASNRMVAKVKVDEYRSDYF